MQTTHGPPTILYLDFDPSQKKTLRQIDGMRRFAKARGWSVVAVPCHPFRPEDLPDTLVRLKPVGCIAGCTAWVRELSPQAFGDIPAVWLDPTEHLPWRNIPIISCDNAAVARMAFRELSTGLPPCYAVVSRRHPHPWTRERVAAFRGCCREARKECAVFPERRNEDVDARMARLVAWAAALPPHCAVFAVNDLAADETACALRAAGRSIPRTATLIGADALDVSPNDGRDLSLSSVRIDFELAGYLAARLLSEILKTSSGNLKAHRADSCRTAAVFGPLLVERRDSTRGRGRREPFILQAMEILRREACEGLTASALAARFRCSRKLFERRFREAMGRPVLDEILAVRMERVMDLLARPDIAIGAIYFRCGFASDRELRSLFLARTGVSMRRWRADHLR